MRTQIDKTELETTLAQFIGAETWYQHQFVRGITFTDGVKYLADTAGAYWLIDEISLAQATKKALRGQPFQVWTLRVSDRYQATLTCDDGNGNKLYRKSLDFTDFPLPEIKLYFADGVILLPSEY